MVKNDTVFQFNTPAEISSAMSDTLTELARQGAKQMLAVALEQEIAAFLEHHKNNQTEEGGHRFVRNGHLPERNIQTGIRDIPVQ